MRLHVSLNIKSVCMMEQTCQFYWSWVQSWPKGKMLNTWRKKPHKKPEKRVFDLTCVKPRALEIGCLGSLVPSGNLTFNYWKSPFLMGKSTISMVIFNSYIPEGIHIGQNSVAKNSTASILRDHYLSNSDIVGGVQNQTLAVTRLENQNASSN